jgi:hypothetical protein
VILEVVSRWNQEVYHVTAYLLPACQTEVLFGEVTLGVYTKADTVQKMKAMATNIIFMMVKPATVPLKYCQPFYMLCRLFPKIERGMFRIIPPREKNISATNLLALP